MIETSQLITYKSSATGTVNHESNLLSCEISLQVYAQIWQMICLCLRLGFCLSTDRTLARICVYRLASGTGEEEMRNNFEHLKHRIKPIQLGVITDYCILDFGLVGLTSQRTIPKI